MTLLEPFALARRDLWGPAGRRILWRSLALSIAAFVLLAIAVQAAIGYAAAGWAGWVQTVLDVLGGLATMVVVWILFPAVATLFAGAMTDGLIDAVERQHYPGAPAHAPSALSGLVQAARFATIAVALNLLLLPLYVALLFVPPLAPVAFLLVNGYLVGREYFHMVASRHLDPAAASALRKTYGWRVYATGLVLAFLFTVPVVNLFAPMLGAAAMVHLFHGLRA